MFLCDLNVLPLVAAAPSPPPPNEAAVAPNENLPAAALLSAAAPVPNPKVLDSVPPLLVLLPNAEGDFLPNADEVADAAVDEVPANEKPEDEPLPKPPAEG